ncbi:chemokine-like receptor 1 [Thunnus albacares]|uniref:chemokine-like receptor 1 n=1 Tax=Thunnus albacares TaxID=8236 RepID=UPI001CF69CA3|nr:chemokine-like receptor 1 [Thunnus albacares]
MMDMTATPSNDTNTSGVCEENGFFNDTYDDLRRSLNIMSVVIYSLAFILGVLGNGVVIWVTGFKMKKTVNTVWILNLAVADFLFTAFLPFSVIYIALDFHWPFGKFMCKLDNTVRYLNIFVSVYFLVVISVDRCVSVVWPVWAQNHRSVRKASCVSLGVWVLGLILSLPSFIFRDIGPSYDDKNILNCYDNYAFSDGDDETQPEIELGLLRFKAMTIISFPLFFAVPFTVIVSCYAVIIHRLRRNRTRASRSNRPFKIIAAVITVFCLCRAPFYIMTLIELWYHIGNMSSVLELVITIGVPLATCLAYLNSCLNPLLYVFIVKDIKDKVCESILNVFETAFREEVSHSHTDTKSVDTSQRLDESVLNTQV